MLPRAAVIWPALVTVLGELVPVPDTPPPLTSISNPRIEGSVLAARYTAGVFGPDPVAAARMVCPSGVEIVPLLVTADPSSMMRPPSAAVRVAPGFTVTVPALPVAGATKAAGGVTPATFWDRMPFSNSASGSLEDATDANGSVDAVNPATLICAPLAKTMPFWLYR